MVVDLGMIDPLNRVFQGFEGQGQWAAIAQELERLIASNSDVVQHVRSTWQFVGRMSFQAAKVGVVLDRDQLGRSLEATIDSGLALLHCLDRWRRAAEEHGQVIAGAEGLTDTIAAVERIRSEALDNWPWTPSREEWDEAIAEFERGESVDVDDAFAAAAGLSREEWLRMVEQRRQTRTAGEDQ